MCFFNKKVKVSTVDEILEINKRNPEKICQWILRNIWYVSDKANHGGEYAQTAEETLTGIYRTGSKGTPCSGDCDDFVILAQECFNRLGIENHFLAIFKLVDYAGSIPIWGDGHAILAIHMDNKWYHFSNWGFKRCLDAKSLEDVPPYIYKKGNWQKCTEKDGRILRDMAHIYNM